MQDTRRGEFKKYIFYGILSSFLSEGKPVYSRNLAEKRILRMI